MDKPVTTDRRRFRYVVGPRPFVAMKGSGGILLDVSDEGLSLDVVGPNLATKRVHLNFDISETGEHFEGLAEIVWKNESGSRVGVRFVDLPDASRRTVQKWLMAKSNSPIGLKDINVQNRKNTNNVETQLWMRPHADLSQSALELAKNTEPVGPAFSECPSVEYATKPPLSSRYTDVVVSDVENGESLCQDTSATSAALAFPEEVTRLVLSNDNLSMLEPASSSSSHDATAQLRPLMENSAESTILGSRGRAELSTLSFGSTSTYEKEFKPASSGHHASVTVSNFEARPAENSATSADLQSPEEVEQSLGSAAILETEFKPDSFPYDVNCGMSNFETQTWLRPRIPAPTTNFVPAEEKPKGTTTVDPYSGESRAEFRSLPQPNVVRLSESEEYTYADIRASFKKAQTGEAHAEHRRNSLKGKYAWHDIFRLVLGGAIICCGIFAVALGIRLSTDDAANAAIYQSVRAFLLDTFSPSNSSFEVVNHAPMVATPLHPKKVLKTSHVHIADNLPINRGPVAINKYEVLDAKTGRRYYPHIGTNVAVKFERSPASPAEHGVVNGVGLTASMGSLPDASDEENGKILQKSSGELPVKEVIPEYPTWALQRNVQGRVTLSAIIATDGSLRDVKIMGPVSILDNAALSAVKEWRYQVHHQNGMAVEVPTQIVVDFSIRMKK